MKGNRKENVREGEKELLHLSVKRSGQGFKGKREMNVDWRAGTGREVMGGGERNEGEEEREWERPGRGKGRKEQGKGRKEQGKGK
jgi:hypothetical protein